MCSKSMKQLYTAAGTPPFGGLGDDQTHYSSCETSYQVITLASSMSDWLP